MAQYFYKIHNFLRKHKFLALLAMIIYVCLTGFLASKIDLEEDITKLVPSKNDDLVKNILEESKFSDKIIFRIKGGSSTPADSMVAYANEITNYLEQDLAPYIEEVRGKIPEKDVQEVYNFVQSNLPIFLTDKDYSQIHNRTQFDSIASRMESGYKQLITPTGFVTKNYFLGDPLNLTTLGLARLQELQVGEQYILYQNYIMTRDRENILLFIDPFYPSSESSNNKEFTQKLDKKITELDKRYGSVSGSYFGSLRYAVANAVQIKQDIQTTVMIAVSVLLIVLVVYYRKFYVPVLLFIPVILAGLTSIAILYVAQGSISAISLGIGAVLLGITLDYPLHILTHLRNGANMKTLYRDISKPTLMSSLTTAMAFSCLAFVNSEALKDLGIFASLSVLFSSVFALLLIPLVYKPKLSEQKLTLLDRISSTDYSKNKPLLYIFTGLFLVSLLFFTKVNFNEDLSQLNYEPAAIKKVELELETLAGKTGKTILLVSFGNSLDEALNTNNEVYKLLQKFEEQGDIYNFSSIGGVVLSTSTQRSRINKWDAFWAPDRQDTLMQSIEQIAETFGFKPESFYKFQKTLEKPYTNIGLKDYEKAGSLYLKDFISTSPELSTVTSTVNLPETHVEQIIDYFESKNGVVALDRKVLNQSFLGDLKSNFNRLILLSLIAVFLVLLVFYRNLLLSLITMLPIVITWVCALGIMYFLKIEFNILNIIISSFIFGLGLDYSIFITNSCLKEYDTGEPAMQTYQASIILSVITTLLGIGALVFAEHPALRSIAVVSILGVLLAASVSFVLQRSIFRKLIFQQKASFSFYPGRRHNLLEKLYHKRALLSRYRYRSNYKEAKVILRDHKEQFLKISRFIADAESLAIINSGIGILPLFIRSCSACPISCAPWKYSMRIYAGAKSSYSSKPYRETP